MPLLILNAHIDSSALEYGQTWVISRTIGRSEFIYRFVYAIPMFRRHKIFSKFFRTVL